MLPVIASANAYNVQSPLVNTPLAGTTAAVHAPVTSVAPSVSGGQANNNNSSSNNSITTSNQQAQAAAVTTPEAGASSGSGSSSFSSFIQNSGTSASSSGPQSAFVAQLAAQQDGSPETQGVLVQYQKLVDDSNVKYAPSEAAKPVDEPASVFGRLLQSDQQQAPVTQAQPVQQQPAKTQAPAENTIQTIATQSVQTSQAQTQQIVFNAPPVTSATGSPQASSSDGTSDDTTADGGTDSIPAHVIHAYAATATRPESFGHSAVESA